MVCFIHRDFSELSIQGESNVRVGIYFCKGVARILVRRGGERSAKHYLTKTIEKLFL